ncbi:hypothetical protein [Gymnodinialimonas sp.]
MPASTFTRALAALPLVATAFVASAPTASANGINVPAPRDPVYVAPVPDRAFPSVFGVNSAIPPVGGTGYIAGTYVNPREGIPGADSDGEISIGYTFGNPIDGLSFSIGANITGLEPLGDSGNFDLSIARAIQVSDTAMTFIGASAGGIGAFGTATVDEEAYSLYISHLTDVGLGASRMPIQVTVGYSDHIERATDGSGQIDEGFFYGIGLGVSPNMSLSVSGTETQYNLGGTVTFDAVPGFSLSGGVYDVTDLTNRQQVSLTAAFSF